jgi:hypothetical protein
MESFVNLVFTFFAQFLITKSFCLQTRERVEVEVRRLREKISDLKIQISTITKGIPMSKIELRDDKKSTVQQQQQQKAATDSNPSTSASSTAKHSAALSTSASGTTSPQKLGGSAFGKSQQAHATQILNQQNPIATG